ncbi:hypothetical protein DFH28DRAFT_1109168 [Melampsora americana]|nr:hypothetical protein DFH28DRAFT_1109168 [Melampsora americana]
MLNKYHADSIILAITLFHSFLMVWPHMENQICKLHHLQPEDEQRFGITDKSPSTEYLEAYNIHAINDRTEPEVSKNLRHIENTLMEDTDFNKLDHLNNYPQSDLTIFWSNCLQGMSDIFEPRHVEIATQYSTPERRRLIMEPPFFQSQDLDLIHPEPSHEEFGMDFEEDFLDPNPVILHNAPHNKKRKQIEGNVVGIQYEEQALNSAHPSSSSHLPKMDGLENKKNSWVKFQFRTLVNLLKWKGASTIWHNSMVSNQIDHFFEQIDRNSYSNLVNPEGISYSLHQINEAVERVRTDVVLSYFGGLGIIFHQDPRGINIQEFIANGWEYLKDYLKEEFLIGQHDSSSLVLPPKRGNIENFSMPFHLLHYILNLKTKSSIHPRLIENLISNWQSQAWYQDHHGHEKFSTFSFILAIETEANLQGKKVDNHPKTKKNNNKPPPKMTEYLTTMVPQSPGLGLTSTNIIYYSQTSYLAKICKQILGNKTEFSKKVENFFKSLKSEMLESLEKARASEFVQLNRTGSKNIRMIEPMMLEKGIKQVQAFMVPAFMACLFILNNNWSSKRVFKNILKTGFDIIQDYFSPWTKIISADRSTIILTSKVTQAKLVRWHNAKESLEYFCLHKGMVSVQPVWFLVELWYEKIIQGKFDMGEDCKLDPTPPQTDMTNEIISFIEKNGITFP